VSAPFAFPAPRRRRRPSLTPLIDVVFLLLVFFMLAARFGAERALPVLPGGGAGAGWDGPPRLVTVGAEGLALNGVATPADRLAGALRPLMPAPDAPVVLRAEERVPLSRAVAVIERLNAAGIPTVVLAE